MIREDHSGKTGRFSKTCSDCKDWRKKMRLIRTTLECTTRQFQRIDAMEDPVMRYRLPLEMTRITTDVGMCLAKMMIEEETELQIDRAEQEIGENPEVNIAVDSEISMMRDECNKLMGIISNLQNVFEEFGNKFSEWVSKPCYSPDQSVGKGIMQDANDEFKTLLE